MLNDYEKVGRWACMEFQRNTLNATARAKVEEIVGGRASYAALLSGCYQKESSMRRCNRLGIVVEPDLYSLDGFLGVRVLEVALYATVGKAMLALVL